MTLTVTDLEQLVIFNYWWPWLLLTLNNWWSLTTDDLDCCRPWTTGDL